MRDTEQRPTQEAWDKAKELVCGDEIHPQHFAVPRVAKYIDEQNALIERLRDTIPWREDW